MKENSLDNIVEVSNLTQKQRLELFNSMDTNKPPDVLIETLRRAVGDITYEKIVNEIIIRGKSRQISWKEAVERFLRKYDSVATRRTYRNGIDCWEDWLKKKGITPLHVTGDIADAYANHCLNTMKPTTANARINPISSLYSYLAKRRDIATSPFVLVHRAKIMPVRKRIPSYSEIYTVIKNAPKRVRFAIRVIIATGVSVNALKNMNFDNNTNTYMTYIKGKFVRQQIKKSRGALMRKLFRNGNPFRDASSASLTVAIQRAFRKAGLIYSAYDIRNRFALSLYKNSGNDVETVRRALHHETIAFTMTYLQSLNDRMIRSSHS